MSRLRQLFQRMALDRATWKGATWGVLLAGLTGLVCMGATARTGLGTWQDMGLFAGAGAVVLGLLAGLLWVLLSIVAAVPRWFLACLLAAIAALVVFFDMPLPFALLFAVPIVLVQAALIGSIAAATRGRWSEGTSLRKGVIVTCLIGAIAADVAFGYWLVWPGFESTAPAATAESRAAVSVPAVEAADPSKPGSYQINRLTYGSGQDQRRPEFGSSVDLQTESVDATPFVSLEGWRGGLREAYWGFTPEQFPRNARVWHPDGEGPFPLVLIVHGNDNMTEAADAGYGYLGELLASQGYVAASVDECFFGSYVLAGGLGGENDGRAWLLLKHLELWREWNRTEGNPFFGRVDLDRIVLIGHSRGGEAAAHAAAFNRLAHYPDDATVSFDFDFGIKGVIAIAPSDSQYEPAGQRTELRDVSYLLLQGSHDADVASCLGLRQFQRVSFSGPGPWFKSLLYIERANHGQFNTVWGRTDLPVPVAQLLNLEPLIDGADQRTIGKTYIAAFLELTLRGNEAYRPLFRDDRCAVGWLPNTRYVSQYRDSGFQTVADFEEDIDVTTTTLEGGAIQASGFTTWREHDLGFRGGGSQDNQVTRIGWGEEKEEDERSKPDSAADSGSSEESQSRVESLYEISLPESGNALDVSIDAALVFDLMDVSDDSEDSETETPLDFTVELTDRDGSKAALPISHFRTVPAPIEAEFTKIPAIEREAPQYASPFDFVLQTFALPLREFAAANEEFDPRKLASIRLRFDRRGSGAILLDAVGIESKPTEEEDDASNASAQN